MWPGLRTVIGVLMALLLGQMPEFTQQYLQRLGGALEALQPMVLQFDALADSQRLSRSDALARLEQTAAPLVSGSGRIEAEAIARYDDLLRARDALSAEPVLTRPEVLVSHLDLDVAEGTLLAFRPAVPVSPDGIAHAIAGFVIGFILTHFAVEHARSRRRRREQRRV